VLQGKVSGEATTIVSVEISIKGDTFRMKLTYLELTRHNAWVRVTLPYFPGEGDGNR